MINNLNDKVAVITGAAKGIGFASAELFLKHGAKVAFCDLHKGDILKAKKRLVKFGEVFAEPADVRKETDIKRFSTEVIKRFRRVDILVNNAGILPRRACFSDHTFSNINNTVDTNLKGTLFMTRAVLGPMLKTRSGVIINLSSEAGITGYSDMAIYCATKFGIRGFSEALDEELIDKGIKVYVVCPGAVKTGLNSGFTGEKAIGMDPERVAELIVEIAGTMPDDRCFSI
ncbi:MAG: SDR family oxidoreductase [Desulfatiglans sp.]|jgi:3-oxoacyl-[acyl-carrier protein] reductase|nr:SDR family oxidoreductase [Desulfatiglans sp.]